MANSSQEPRIYGFIYTRRQPVVDYHRLRVSLESLRQRRCARCMDGSGVIVRSRSPYRRNRLHTTSISLLEQLRQPGDQASWARFVRLYYPLIYDWARRAGAGPEDAADLVQDVLTVLIRRLPEFKYDSSKTAFICHPWRAAFAESIAGAT